MNWFTVRSEPDVEKLMNEFGEFHDGCLREVHIWTGHYVDEDLSMVCASELDTQVRMLIQRQFRNPSAIELLFEQVTAFHLSPSPQNYDSIIFTATLKFKEDGSIYWADNYGEEQDDDVTWVTAKVLSWRPVSEWMGKQLRYGPSGTGSNEGAAV